VDDSEGAFPMRGRCLVCAGLAAMLCLADVAAQQGVPQDCFGCVLGIWDEQGLISTHGMIEPNVPKDVFLGIKFADPFSALLGVEFSIAGMRFEENGIVVLDVQELIPAPGQLGDLRAPADTSRTSTGRGGLTLAYSQPVFFDAALLKITILSLGPVSNHVLQVKRHYPTTNPAWNTAVFIRPDIPYYTAVRISVGCYDLNWDGQQGTGCQGTTGLQEATWTRVKRLYQ